MGVKIRKHGTVIASFAAPQEIVIDHANDSIKVGDGTNLMGPLQNVGGVLCYPVKIHSDITDAATNATLTGGTARAKVTDGVDNVQVATVGAEKALKVSVISTVGGGAAPAFTDDAAFTIATTQVTPIGALADETAPDSVDEGDVGAVRMTLDRLLKIQLAGVASGVAVPVTDNGGSLTIDAASLPLPTGASTEATLASLLTSSQLIDDMIATVAAAVPTKVAFVGGTDGTNARALKTDASGELQIDVLSSALPSGAATEATLATLATAAKQDTQITSLQLIDDVVFTDDAAFTPATSKVMAIGAMLDATTPDVVDEGDIGILRMTANRDLHVTLRFPGTGNAAFGQQAAADSMPVVIASDQVKVPVHGDVAHDAADAGNPQKMGGVAKSANPTAVADGDRTNFIADLAGRQIVGFAPRDLVTRGSATISTTTETSIIAAGGVGVFHDIVGIILTNTSATAVRVDIRDVTAGTVQFSVALAANGGAVIMPNIPFNQTTANSAWTAQLSAAVTDVRVLFLAIKKTA